MRASHKTYWTIPEVQLLRNKNYSSGLTDLTIEVVDNVTALRGIEKEWASLSLETGTNERSFQWYYKWWQQFDDKPGYYLFVILLKRGERTVGLIPLYIKSLIVKHFRIHTQLMFLGTQTKDYDSGDDETGEAGISHDIMLERGYEKLVVRTLIEFLKFKRYLWAELHFNGTYDSSNLFKYFLPELNRSEFLIEGRRQIGRRIKEPTSANIKKSKGSSAVNPDIGRSVQAFMKPAHISETVLENADFFESFAGININGQAKKNDRYEISHNEDMKNESGPDKEENHVYNRMPQRWNIIIRPIKRMKNRHSPASLGLFKIQFVLQQYLKRKKSELGNVKCESDKTKGWRVCKDYLRVLFQNRKYQDKKVQFKAPVLPYHQELPDGRSTVANDFAYFDPDPVFIPLSEIDTGTSDSPDYSSGKDIDLIATQITNHDDVIRLKDHINSLEQHFGIPLLTPEWIGSSVQTFCPPDRIKMITVKAAGIPVALAPLSIRGGLFSHLEVVGSSVLEEPCGLLYRDTASLNKLVGAMLALRMPLFLKGFRHFSPEIQAIEREMGSGRWISLIREEKISCVSTDGNWEAFEKQISSSRRSSFRRLERLAGKKGKVGFEAVSPTPDNVDRYLDEVYRVEAANWKGRTGTAMQTYPLLGNFFRMYSRSITKQRKLKLFFLRVGDQTVAVQLTVIHDNRLWIYKVGHDESWSWCSPGILLMHKVVRYCFDNGLTGCEYLGSDEPWLHIWANEFHSLVSYEIYPRNLKGYFDLWGAQGKTYSHKVMSIVKRKWVH